MRVRCGLLILAASFLLGGSARAQGVTDTVFAGALKLLTPFLGTDTMDSYRLEGDVKTALYTWVRTIEVGIEDTQRVIRINTIHVSSASGDTTKNRLVIDATDLSLREHTLWSPSDSAEAFFARQKLWGWIARPGVPWQAFTVMTGRPVFPDDGISPWLLELLPLSDRYRAVVPRFNMWRKGETHLTVKVAGSEELKSGDVSVPCWVVDVEGAGGPPNYKQRRWISKASRRLLQLVMRKGPEDPEYWGVMRNWF